MKKKTHKLYVHMCTCKHAHNKLTKGTILCVFLKEVPFFNFIHYKTV